MKTGIHIDFTTLLGAVDALEMIPETQELPITFSHLLTLSQFFDAIVLHDKVFYENNDSPQHQPYGKAVEDSRITETLGPGILVSHQNTLVNDSFKYEGIEWALNNISKISKLSIDYSLLPRKSHYRAITLREGFDDNENPYTEDNFATARREGDGKLAEKIDNALTNLEANKIGRMGLHIMFRLFYLDRWLSTEKRLSYYPNFSRNPLIHETLVKPQKPRDFMRWAVDEIKMKKEAWIANITDKEEVDDFVFKLSPIFIRCLAGAKHPRDLIDNAMTLRNSTSAQKIRKLHEKLSANSLPGEDKTLGLRPKLRSALKVFDDQNRAMTQRTVGASASLSLKGPEVRVSIKRTSTDKKKLSNLAFFVETLESSLCMVNAMEAIEKVFGSVSSDDQWILSAYNQRKV